jgi:hypothetical protein
VSRNIRRVSLRVVNLAGAGLEDSIRLPDDEDELKVDDDKEEELPDLSRDMPIRGRTLGCFGPQSRIRLALFNFLVYPSVVLFFYLGFVLDNFFSSWTEPVILVLIVINAVVLTIQASHSLTLPDNSSPRPVKGYFHAWEDYALFVLFAFFTYVIFFPFIISNH